VIGDNAFEVRRRRRGIASRIGYLSDTAFSIAFKRSTGHSPGRFRALSREA